VTPDKNIGRKGAEDFRGKINRHRIAFARKSGKFVDVPIVSTHTAASYLRGAGNVLEAVIPKL